MSEYGTRLIIVKKKLVKTANKQTNNTNENKQTNLQADRYIHIRIQKYPSNQTVELLVDSCIQILVNAFRWESQLTMVEH